VPEIEFTIDATSGEFKLHVRGIAGPACDDVAKLVEELAGEPVHQETTAEYHLRPSVRGRAESRIQSKRS
jgi:hypothetical protein